MCVSDFCRGHNFLRQGTGAPALSREMGTGDGRYVALAWRPWRDAAKRQAPRLVGKIGPGPSRASERTFLCRMA